MNVCQYINGGAQSIQYNSQSDRVLKNSSFIINALLKINGKKILLKTSNNPSTNLFSSQNMPQTIIFTSISFFKSFHASAYSISQYITFFSIQFMTQWISFHNISHSQFISCVNISYFTIYHISQSIQCPSAYHISQIISQIS